MFYDIFSVISYGASTLGCELLENRYLKIDRVQDRQRKLWNQFMGRIDVMC